MVKERKKEITGVPLFLCVLRALCGESSSPALWFE
jgi:hypothetical protein